MSEADPPPREQTPPRSRPPPEQTPTGADTPPGTKYTPSPGLSTPPGTKYTPPGLSTPSPPEADSGIRSTSGRYASYWNAFLLKILLLLDENNKDNFDVIVTICLKFDQKHVEIMSFILCSVLEVPLAVSLVIKSACSQKKTRFLCTRILSLTAMLKGSPATTSLCIFLFIAHGTQCISLFYKFWESRTLSDNWWWSLETCSNLFIWGASPEQHMVVATETEAHVFQASGMHPTGMLSC